MATRKTALWTINVCFNLVLLHLLYVNGEHKDFYIVFLNEEGSRLRESHIDVLYAVKNCQVDAEEALVYSYTKSFNAFVAKLHEEEAKRLLKSEGVVAVLRNKYRKLHTTKSWDFIGLTETARRSKMESDIIVGLLDTGITIQSESFNDTGFGPRPPKWKGNCSHFANFSGCNKKIIGAKHYKLDKNPDPIDILSPIDVEGHGTHTSSTLAGNLVPNANLYGLAKGTARGAVPSARIAMYKVCWASSGCSDMDMLAAFEDAIHDGVDIISISVGGLEASYDADPIAIGAFHAMRKGILTVASAGNDGPRLGSVANHAPWILTVAASGTNRQFRSKVQLGNGATVSGVGVSVLDTNQKQYPLVDGTNTAINNENKDRASNCYEEALNPNKVKGKVVMCKLAMWGSDSVVKSMGGIGTLVVSERYLDAPQIFMAPATMVNTTTAEKISQYLNSSRSAPSAAIYKSEEVSVRAPFTASFSSRGPSFGSKHILKPDISAPGIDILAAYTPIRSLTGLKGDTLHSKFTLMSGTSMACPHVSGVAAYIKSFHSNWSSSAIKSAILTSATPMSSRVNPEAEFAYGVGQVTPTRAISPGLVYEMNKKSYIQFLCHEGYSESKIAVFVKPESVNCSSLLPGRGTDALNYPTMQLSLKPAKEVTIGVFVRRVTNVGPALSIYNATIKAPKGVEITVKPTVLAFSRVFQKRSFKVVVKAKPTSSSQILSGSLVWKSSRHIVRSPIVIYTPDQEDFSILQPL